MATTSPPHLFPSIPYFFSPPLPPKWSIPAYLPCYTCSTCLPSLLFCPTPLLAVLLPIPLCHSAPTPLLASLPIHLPFTALPTYPLFSSLHYLCTFFSTPASLFATLPFIHPEPVAHRLHQVLTSSSFLGELENFCLLPPCHLPIYLILKMARSVDT